MEFSKTWLPDLNRPGMRTDDKVQAINEYLISLDKQIRHVLSNLDEDNFSDALIKNLNATSEKIREIEEGMTSTAPPTSGGGGSFDGELPIASKTQAGIMMVGSNLKVSDGGVVSVDTATEAEEGNAKPITSAAARAAVDSVSAVLYGKEQRLTDEQKAQARENIGVTSVPFSHSWDGTVLSVTSGSGTTSADLKGPKGDTGATGPQGPKGDAGAAGSPGNDGEDGVGIASVKQTTTSTADGGTNVITVTLTNGTKSTFSVKNGSKGSTGASGSGGLTMKLVWTNASPQSVFKAQTVSISNASSYQFYLIGMIPYYTQAVSNAVWAIVGQGCSWEWAYTYLGASAPEAVTRAITANSSGIKFGDTYGNKLNQSTGGTHLVPYKIYGIKGAT